MGVPVIEAPCEAEAQCAALCAAGKVFATGTEDMDALTFGTALLLRNLNLSEAQKKPIVEIDLKKVLEGLGLSMDQFIDFCILSGCDYCHTIRGIGPKRAYELIKKHRSLEVVLKNLDPAKYPIPENFNYQGARELFKNPQVIPPDQVEMVWGPPDEQGLLQYLVTEKGFSEDRVKKGIQKLNKARGSAVQGRLDGFFMVTPCSPVKKQKIAEKAKGKVVVTKRGAGSKKIAPKADTGSRKRKRAEA